MGHIHIKHLSSNYWIHISLHRFQKRFKKGFSHFHHYIFAHGVPSSLNPPSPFCRLNAILPASSRLSAIITDLGASRGGPMGKTVLGVLGESITLSLALLDSQHIDNVVWIFNTSIISKEWREEATANQLIEFKDPDQNTVWVSSQDYSLKIVQLKMEHAGLYQAYLCSNARVASVKHINLRIYREFLS